MFQEDDRGSFNFQDNTFSDSTPSSLYDICLDTIVRDISIICLECDDIGGALVLKDDIILPREICERVLQRYQKSFPVSDKFINIFRDKQRTRIKTVKLDRSLVTDNGLKILLDHNLQELVLHKCESLTIDSLEEITRHSQELVMLNVGTGVQFFTEWNVDWQNSGGFAIIAPTLQHLILRRQPYPNVQLQLLPTLTHLDLSECLFLANLHRLCTLENLVSLTLYNVPRLHDIMDWICSHKKLQFLDISQSNERTGRYDNPNQVLSRIVKSLPFLDSLDISGTNLAGNGVAGGGCDVPGLAERMTRPLSFLGLYGTLHAACCRHDIPALKITGHANEEQILAAAVAYMDRPEILTRVLNDLYHLFRYENDKHANVPRALAIVLESMERHILEKHIQISGSATLFYIVKGKEKATLSVLTKQQIVSALLNGMESHMEDDTMMRNGCLTLCQFKIPTDVVFEYKRVVTVLLHGVSDANQEGFVQRIAIYLLNSLACQVDGGQKQFLGDSGAISKMLVLIADRLERHVCDDVLEVAWSTMWNVTDETPDNCKRFLDDKGMDFFLGCLEKFPEKEELLRNMMGLLGNVAEVAELRPVFMTTHFLTVFSDLLDSTSDGIEVSYNAAGVLAHLASDGPTAWTVSEPSRESVLSRMEEAVKRWNLSTKRNINYRSFQPILSLLGAYHTPQCQYWALWALANLTTVYPEKYCSLVEAEKGGDLLKEVIDHPEPCQDIKTLAKLVWHNCYY